MESSKLVPLFFLFGGGLLLLVLAFLQRSKAKKAQSWPNVPGNVLSSEMTMSTREDSDGDVSTVYYPNVVYTYSVDGNTYTSDAIGVGKASTTQAKAAQILAGYPVGTAVTVYYNPSDPTQAVLNPKGSNFIAFLLLGIVLIVIGVVVFVLL
jgi:hypothetical protein